MKSILFLLSFATLIAGVYRAGRMLLGNKQVPAFFADCASVITSLQSQERRSDLIGVNYSFRSGISIVADHMIKRLVVCDSMREYYKCRIGVVAGVVYRYISAPALQARSELIERPGLPGSAVAPQPNAKIRRSKPFPPIKKSR